MTDRWEGKPVRTGASGTDRRSRFIYSAQPIVTGKERTFKRSEMLLQVCWCGSKRKKVPAADVVHGVGWSCGKAWCNEQDCHTVETEE